ncbi:MAG: hypothetical protein WBA74_26245 [Cyclobacteriaceae bacterium]
MKHILTVTGAIFLLVACSSESKSPELSPSTSVGGFGDYWYQGKAELTGYKLEQARYGEIHEGTAVTVFVTEDFSERKQVKLDNPGQAGNDAVKVLKLNIMKKFNTGIYDYSTMQSVFTPIDRTKYSNTLKVTTSSQEWCGHTFTQLNLEQDGYRTKLFSYFESEGDQQKLLPKVWLENELWNLIRIDPSKLPSGTIEIIPDLLFQRLKHTALKSQKAIAKIETTGDESVFVIEYPELNRKLAIRFESDFPHRINGWEDSYKSGYGSGAQVLTTRATRMKSMMSPYWSQNSVSDVKLRKQLGLGEN